ncbi:ABC transporter permease [Vibrio sp. PP-XX7]
MLGYCLRRFVMSDRCCTDGLYGVFYAFLHLSGDLATAIAGPEASSDQIEQIRVQFGLDKPMVLQYLDWLWRAVHLDFGASYYFPESVMSLIRERLPITLTLGAIALSVATLIAIPLGVVAAIKQDTWIDRLALLIAVFGQAMPSFFFGLVLIIVFAVNLHWLPAGGTGTWQHFIMPAIALGYYATLLLCA